MPGRREKTAQVPRHASPERDGELALAQRMLGKESPEAVLAAGAVNQVLTFDQFRILRDGLEELVVREELLRTALAEHRRSSG